MKFKIFIYLVRRLNNIHILGPIGDNHITIIGDDLEFSHELWINFPLQTLQSTIMSLHDFGYVGSRFATQIIILLTLILNQEDILVFLLKLYLLEFAEILDRLQTLTQDLKFCF